MADVEGTGLLARVDLSVAARVTGIAAVVLGAAELLSLAAGFGLTQAAYAVIGTDGFFWTSRSCGSSRWPLPRSLPLG